MIKILFFASVRDKAGISQTTYQLPNTADQNLVSEISAYQLLQKLEIPQEVIKIPNLRCAINQKMSSLETMVKDGDEVAYFPPVTGG